MESRAERELAPVGIGTGSSSKVELDPLSGIVRKQFRRKRDRSIDQMALMEFGRLKRFRELIDDLPFLSCPGPIAVSPFLGFVEMGYCPGLRLDRALSEIDQVSDDIEHIATQLATGIGIYTSEFNVPHDFSPLNVIYDPETRIVYMLDFITPRLALEPGWNLRVDPLSFSLGRLVGGSAAESVRVRTWFRGGLWQRYRTMSAGVLTAASRTRELDLALIDDVSRSWYANYQGHGRLISRIWARTAGAVMFERRRREIIEHVGQEFQSPQVSDTHPVTTAPVRDSRQRAPDDSPRPAGAIAGTVTMGGSEVGRNRPVDRVETRLVEIGRGRHGTVEFDPTSMLVCKRFVGAAGAGARAEREFDQLTRVSAAFASEPFLTSPSPVRVEPDHGRIWMTHCRGERLDLQLAGSDEIDSHIEHLADQIAIAAMRYVDEIREPWHSLNCQNIIYERSTRVLCMFDFASSSLAPGVDAEQDALEISLGRYLATVVHSTLRIRRLSSGERVNRVRQERLFCAVLKRVASTREIRAAAIQAVSDDLYDYMTRQRRGFRGRWFKTVGRMAFRRRRDRLIGRVLGDRLTGVRR
jgi:hypothetical protein